MAVSALRAEEVDRVTLLQGDDGLLPVLHLAVRTTHATVLAAHDERVDVGDLDLEEGLNGVFDLDLVGLARDLEDDLIRLAKLARLLGQNDGLLDDALRIHLAASFVDLAVLGALPGNGAGTSAPAPRQRLSRALAASFESTS